MNSLGIYSPGCEVCGYLGVYVKWPNSKRVFVPNVRFLSFLGMYDLKCDVSRLLEGLFQGVKTLYCLGLSILGVKSVSCLGACVQSRVCGLCVICGSVATM